MGAARNEREECCSASMVGCLFNNMGAMLLDPTSGWSRPGVAKGGAADLRGHCRENTARETRSCAHVRGLPRWTRAKSVGQ